MRWLATLVMGSALMLPKAATAGLFDIETKLTVAESAGDGFGQSVGISGNTAIVGSWRDDSGTGSAYLFDVTTGNQLFRLTASDGAEQDRFGTTVGISGNTAIVGSSFNDGDRGAAYLFDVDPLSPTFGDELFKLTASDAAVADHFANAAISGNRAIVGAWGDDDLGRDSGAAYLFDVDPLSPTFGDELFKLTATDAEADDAFGHRVAISGNRAIVATCDESAYLFDVTSGDELFKLTCL